MVFLIFACPWRHDAMDYIKFIIINVKREIIFRFLYAFAISILLSFLVLHFAFPKMYKYTFKQERLLLNTTDGYIDYYDLNGDGNSERIVYNQNPELSNFLVYDDYKIIDQWTFKGLMNLSRDLYGDFDHDGLSEIGVFSYVNDSIFFHVAEPFDDSLKYLRQNIFVDKYHFFEGQRDISTYPLGTWDLNGDGFNEYIFSIFAGHSCEPRRLCAYDIVNDTMIKSISCGAGFLWLKAFDLDGDGIVEFTGETNAFGNCKGVLPYDDSCSWLMAFDHDLTSLFEPVAIGAFTSSMDITPFKPYHTTYLAALHKYRGIKKIPSELMLFDTKGRLIRKKEIRVTSQIDEIKLLCVDDKSMKNLFLIYPECEVYKLDTSFNIIWEKKIKGIRKGEPRVFDLDADGVNEYLFQGVKPDKVIVTDEDFDKIGIITITNNMAIRNMALVASDQNKPQLFLQDKDHSFYFSMTPNRNRYLIITAIIFSTLILVLLSQQVNLFFLRKRYERSRKITELQLRAVRNQVDPHFSLNILNSIGNLFLQQDTDKANYIFGKYAGMLRNTITSSDKITVTLEEEIENVTHYLELEKYRFGEKFDYRITIEEGVNAHQQVPKMLVHTFVENAIKHGIRHLDGKGLIEILANKRDKLCLIEITDNGVGRKRAAEYSKLSTGKGLHILDEILLLYRKMEGVRITYQIDDVTDETGDVKGTKAVILIPLK